MDKEQINKLEEIIEKHLFGKTNNPEYELKKMQVMILYLIYKKLKNIDERLNSIDQSLFEMVNLGLFKK